MKITELYGGWSHAKQRMIERCGKQFYFRYIEGLKVPPDLGLLRGDAAHQGQEHNYRQKVQTHRDIGEDELKDVTAGAFEQAVEKREYVLGNDYEKRSDGEPKKARAIAKDDAIACATTYHKQVAPTIHPAVIREEPAIELRIVVDSPKLPVSVQGVIDLIEERKGDGDLSLQIIRDTKTRTRKPHEGDEHADLQPTFYELCYRVSEKKPSAGIILDNIILGKKGVSTFSTPTTRDATDLSALVPRIEASVKLVEAEVFIPTNPGNWWCSKRFCGYWDLCPFGEKGRSRS